MMNKVSGILLVGLGFWIAWSSTTNAGNWNKGGDTTKSIELYPNLLPGNTPENEIDDWASNHATLVIGNNEAVLTKEHFRQYNPDEYNSEMVYLQTKNCPKPFSDGFELLGDKPFISYVLSDAENKLTRNTMNLNIDGDEFQMCFNINNVDVNTHEYKSNRLRFFRHSCPSTLTQIASNNVNGQYSVRFCLDQVSSRQTKSLTTSSSKIEKAKSTCTDLGFTAGTEKHGECVLKLMDN